MLKVRKAGVQNAICPGYPLAAAGTKLGKTQIKAMKVDTMIRAGQMLSESAHKHNFIFAVCNCYPSQVSSPHSPFQVSLKNI